MRFMMIGKWRLNMCLQCNDIEDFEYNHNHHCSPDYCLRVCEACEKLLCAENDEIIIKKDKFSSICLCKECI